MPSDFSASLIEVAPLVRRRLLVALGLSFVFACASAQFSVRGVDLCAGRLAPVVTPTGWAAWSVTTIAADGRRLGPFVVAGTSMLAKNGLGLSHAVLYDPRYCPSTGVDLRAWFEDGPQPSYMRNPGELTLRQAPDGTTFVVVGSVPERQGSVLASFRRESGLTLGLVSSTDVGFAAAFLLSAFALGLAARANGRALALARGPTALAEDGGLLQAAQRAARAGRWAYRVAAIVALSAVVYLGMQALAGASWLKLE